MGDLPTLNRQLGINAYRGTSFTPERRADQDIADYAAAVDALKSAAFEAAETGAQLAVAHAEVERFAAGYVKRLSALWAAKSRCMSPMIVGPANFPTARNRKRMDTEHKRLGEFVDWLPRARKAAMKAIAAAGQPAVPVDQNAPSGTETVEINGVRIVRNFDLDRVQIVFGAKPDIETIAALKGAGWNWSPRNSAWQRKLTDAAFRSAQRIAA
jgi:hypothetical protein